MVGMDRYTGKTLDGWDHLAQSLGDILSTPLLTRVFRRDYGSEAIYLLDKPGTTTTLLDFTAIFGEAIDKWEPRFRLRQCWFEQAGADGAFTVHVDGIYYPRGHLGDYTTGVKRGVNLPLPSSFFVTGLV